MRNLLEIIENFETVGDFLRFLRTEEGDTQEQLGDKIGTTGKHVSKWETNRHEITRKYALKLGKLFSLDPEVFTNFESVKRREEGKLSPREYKDKVSKPINSESSREDIKKRLRAGEDAIRYRGEKKGISRKDLVALLEYFQGQLSDLEQGIQELDRQIQNLLRELLSGED